MLRAVTVLCCNVFLDKGIDIFDRDHYGIIKDWFSDRRSIGDRRKIIAVMEL